MLAIAKRLTTWFCCNTRNFAGATAEETEAKVKEAMAAEEPPSTFPGFDFMFIFSCFGAWIASAANVSVSHDSFGRMNS